MKDEILLSVVVNARNDNHGGRMIERLQSAVFQNFMLFEKYRIKSEIIVVDYNPPDNKPLLSSVLKLPKESQYCSVREIVVPPEIHMNFKDSSDINVYVLLAQNVGIRRAMGKYVISVMADIILSEDMVKSIAADSLDENAFYRADRVDVNRSVLDADISEIHSYLNNNIIQIQTRYGRMPFTRSMNKTWKKILGSLNEYTEKMRLHTNASGDFIMMSKDNWHKLNGFAEIDVLGRYVDAVMCYAAYYSGLREKMYGHVFHIDHDSKWRVTTPSFFEKIAFNIFPASFVLKSMSFFRSVIDYLSPEVLAVLGRENKYEKIGVKPMSRSQYRDIVQKLRSGERSVVINGHEWGLNGIDLEENIMVRAAKV